MNGIKKKIMCLALSLCFLAVSSQAQAVSILTTFREIGTTGCKGIFIMLQMYPECKRFGVKGLGLIGIGESMLEVVEGKSNLIIMLCEICRNIGIATPDDDDRVRGIGAAGVAIVHNSPVKKFERAIEVIPYIAKKFGFTDYHRLIDYLKTFSLLLQDDYFSLSPNAKVQDNAKKVVAINSKFMDARLGSLNLYSTSQSQFYARKGLFKLTEATINIAIDNLDTDLSTLVIIGNKAKILPRDLYILNQLCSSSLPVLGPVSIAIFQARSVYHLTKNSNDYNSASPSISFKLQGRTVASKIFDAGFSSFKKALELEKKNQEVLFLYSQAHKCFRACISALRLQRDGDDNKIEQDCNTLQRVCKYNIRSLIQTLILRFPLPDDDEHYHYVQTLRKEYKNCYKKILNAEDEAGIREALINLKSDKY